ncbi:MAG: helix-turn-helix transcriptional regulator [Cyanobacteria bacterium J06639_14]
MGTKQTIAANLQRLRLTKNLGSQEVVAKALNLGTSAYRDREQARVSIALEDVIIWAPFFGLSPDNFAVELLKES